MTTVAEMISALQKLKNPNAVLLWGANGSCVVHAVTPTVKLATVAPINEHTFSTLGIASERTVTAVLLDVLG